MYKIVRFYRDNHDRNGMTIKEGLTLEEAREHCNDPETSSRTREDGSHEEEHGPWFDGYREE